MRLGNRGGQGKSYAASAGDFQRRDHFETMTGKTGTYTAATLHGPPLAAFPMSIHIAKLERERHTHTRHTHTHTYWSAWEAFGGNFGRLEANIIQHEAVLSHL